jgi:hypothetical protein
MAARRLIIVLLVLLGMSTLAAALAPPPQSGDESPTTTGTAKREHREPARGQLVADTIDARSKRPQTVSVPLGDQLSLRVKSSRTGEVEIPDLGLLEDVTRFDPARFDILASSRGSHEVRIVGSKHPVGFLEFGDSKAGRDKSDEGQ